jgi:uncharacterized protein YbjT (DUF2867 family)
MGRRAPSGLTGPMTTDVTTKPILVLGGTGTVGRRVVAGLAARGVPVRGGSRSGRPPFDWTDDTTWDPVLEGVRAAFLVYYPDLVAPGSVETIASFVDRAMARGVRRLVLLSGRGEEQALRAEKVLTESGATWTVVRSAFFAQNFSEGNFADSTRSGVLALPAGDVEEPFIDVDDIADVVVAALTEPGHEDRLYEVTGPELLTFAEAVERIADATGRPLRYQQISVPDFAAAMSAAGVPDEVAEVVVEVFSTVLDGRNAHLADGVQRALGRRPRDLAGFARRAAAAGAWTA